MLLPRENAHSELRARREDGAVGAGSVLAVFLRHCCNHAALVVRKVQSVILRSVGRHITSRSALYFMLLLGGCTAGLIGGGTGSDGNGGADAGDNPPATRDSATDPTPDAAMPTNDGSVPLPDSGTPDTGVVDNPFLTDPLNNCTSGLYSSASRGLEMQPGQPCITCHLQQGGDAPIFTIAGTVYPTGHEASGCNGVGGTSVIRVMDANGGVLFDLTPNAVGTFASLSEVPAGFRVKVLTFTGERAMLQSPPHGDCNACHTPYGAGDPTAPGRIRMP